MDSEKDLLSEFNWADRGAGESALEAAEADLRLPFPHDYLNVLRAHDGGKGWVGAGAYLNLWSVEELVDGNHALEAGQFVPGTVLIGSDGGGEVYGVRIEGDTTTYARFPAVGLSLELGIYLGASWEAFLHTLAESR